MVASPTLAVKAMGRWSSNAHLSYSFVSNSDLRAATSLAVSAAVVAGHRRASFVVGSFNPSSIFEDLVALDDVAGVRVG